MIARQSTIAPEWRRTGSEPPLVAADPRHGRGPEKAHAIADNLKRWLVALALTAVFAAMQIQQSLMHGSLAVPSTYDDIAYFVEGARYLEQFHAHGFRGLFSQFLLHPPGAPLSTGVAFLGFALFGLQPWAAPAANAILLLLFVRAFLGVAGILPLGQAVLLAMALLGAPYFGQAMLQFRPDLICGLVIASGTFFILLRAGWLHDRKDQIVAGLLLGAALWCKPHIFHLTLILFGAAMLLASWRAFRHRDFRTPSGAILVTGLTGLVVALPYYALAMTEVVNYIWTVVFGAQSSVWVRSRSVEDHLLFYLTGLFGRQSLGAWLYASILLGLGVLFAAWRRQDRRLLAQAGLVAAMVMAAYLAVTIPSFKGPHGFPFTAIFLTAGGLASIALARALGPILSWVFCVALLMFSLWQFVWPYQAAYNNASVTSAFAQSRWAMLDEVVSLLGTDGKGLTVYQATPAKHLNESTLNFEYLRRGATPPQFEKLFFSDLEQHGKKIAKVDFAIVPTPDFKEVFSIPTASSQFREKVIEAIEQSGRFEPPVRVADKERGGAILIYRAKSEN